MVVKKSQVPSGPPRWTAVVAAVAAVGALIWAITSHFVPKPNLAPPMTTQTTTPTSNLNISGSGNVGVGTMSGGQITNSATAPATPSSAAK